MGQNGVRVPNHEKKKHMIFSCVGGGDGVESDCASWDYSGKGLGGVGGFFFQLFTWGQQEKNPRPLRLFARLPNKVGILVRTKGSN